MTTRREDLLRLEAEAQHASDRLRLYRARAYGMKATSPERMRDLERISERAAERLAAARAGTSDGPSDPDRPSQL